MSNRYNTILIATDGSENSKKAITSGIEIAKNTDAKVYAVYVIVPVSTPMSRRGPDWAKAATENQNDLPLLMRNEGKKATGYIEKLGQEANLNVESVILEGDPADEIIKFADKYDIDLVTMGTRGHSGIKRFMVGSVADKVVRHSDKKVLIVPS